VKFVVGAAVPITEVDQGLRSAPGPNLIYTYRYPARQVFDYEASKIVVGTP
jgi:hypothetical protein